MGEKTVVIGLDGASPEILEKLSRQGTTPHLKQILEDGFVSTLRSTIHPISPAAWCSIATGLNPGEHGIYDFVRYHPGSYRLDLLNGGSMRGQTYWEYLSQAGKKVGVANVPFTYPPKPLNGFMISGLDAPSADYNYTYPKGMKQEINKNIGEYIIDIMDFKSSHEDMIRALQEMLDGRLRLFHYLYEKYKSYDHLFFCITETDRIFHFFWHLLDDLWSDSDGAIKKNILSCFEKIDNFVGFVKDNLTEDASLLVVSDHGFGPYHKDVYLNKFLMEEGFLTFSDNRQENSLDFSESIDWSRTKAYSYGYFGNIRLNIVGREPQGIVKPGRDAEQTKTELMKLLYDLEDPDDGKQIVDQTYKRKEIYVGGRVEYAPDLLIKMRDYSYVSKNMMETKLPPRIVMPPAYLSQFTKALPRTGEHRLDGIFVLYGADKNNVSGPRNTDFGVCDLAPTILAMHNVPHGHRFDGRLLRDVLTEESMEGVNLDGNGPEAAFRPDRETQGLLEDIIRQKDAYVKLQDQFRETAACAEDLKREFEGLQSYARSLERAIATQNELVRELNTGLNERDARLREIHEIVSGISVANPISTVRSLRKYLNYRKRGREKDTGLQ